MHTSRDVIAAHRVAVCAGLHSDRLAQASGIGPGVRILPFRGECSQLVPARAGLVRGLVYPVPGRHSLPAHRRAYRPRAAHP